MSGYVYRGNLPLDLDPEVVGTPPSRARIAATARANRTYACNLDQLGIDLRNITQMLAARQLHAVLAKRSGAPCPRVTCPVCGALHGAGDCDVCPILQPKEGA